MTDKNRNTTTNTSEREILLRRTFDAPRGLVFEAFSRPEHIEKWWGPDGFSTTTKEMCFEVGGDWIFTMHGPDGTDYPNHIVYTEIKKQSGLGTITMVTWMGKAIHRILKLQSFLKIWVGAQSLICACSSPLLKRGMKQLSLELLREANKH